MITLKDKITWVTGASSGIGEALAKELNNQGAKVIISARRKEELERVKADCAHPDMVAILVLDLIEISSFEAKVQEAMSFFGTVHILFNNGGISQRSMALETPLSVDRRIMEIDYFGTIALTKCVLPFMLKKQSGHVVTTSSLVGKFGSPWRSSYAAAKHALHGFFDSIRTELYEDNIKFTMVCPGFINTAISINALAADGKPTGEMDNAQANGMSAQDCARKIIEATKAEKLEVVIGGTERFGVLLKRFLPRVFAKVIRKQNVR